jgi:hypothetical protein
MFEAEHKGVLATNGVPWSDEEIALAIGGHYEETKCAVTSLVTKGVASRDKNGALMNRRMYRDEKIRRDTRNRVAAFRLKQESNGECNAVSNAKEMQCTETEDETEVLEVPKKSLISQAQLEVIYKAYPRHKSPKSAYKAIAKVLRSMEFDDLLLKVNAYTKQVFDENKEEKYIPYPATWFNDGSYMDEGLIPKPKREYKVVSWDEYNQLEGQS